MPITREFLGGERPLPQSAAAYLLERFEQDGEVDLSRVIVVSPAARAGRRLLEILVELAQQRSLLLAPPDITTVGRLPEKLYQPKRPFATRLVQQLAWAQALRATDRAVVEKIVSEPPDEEDQARWMDLGELLRQQHTELAADVLTFNDVARLGGELPGFNEADRWRAMHQVQENYHRLLDSLELWDIQSARLVAFDFKEYKTDQPIVLMGAVDLNLTMRKILNEVADQVTALIPGPPAWSDRFDEHGCLNVEKWQSIHVPLKDEQIQRAEGPNEQAQAVAARLAAWRGQYRADEIVVGAPDPRLAPFIQRRLHQYGVKTQWTMERVMSHTAPYRLLQIAGQFAESRRYRDFAALMRHPNVFDWLCEQAPLAPPPDFLSQLDDYYNAHLVSRIDGQWLGEPEDHASLAAAYQAIDKLLQGMSGAEKRLDEWAQRLERLLLDIYGRRKLDRDDPQDRITIEACRRIGHVLEEQRAIPPSLAPRRRVGEAVRLTLSQLESTPLPPSDTDVAGNQPVALLGWLDLALEDAKAIVLTSFNEGFVPTSGGADLFLPDQLRRHLGLDDNARRYARDAYALSIILAARQDFCVIVGRRDAEGDPLIPSRLLFAAPEEVIARRSLRFFAPEPLHSPLEQPPPPGRLRDSARPPRRRRKSALEVPRPAPLPTPIEHMRVTEFRTYLACPYRYYLSRALKLQRLTDALGELDPASFGTLVHDSLEAFGKSEHRDCAEPEQILQHCGAYLDELVLQRYGPSPSAAVMVQVEQARARIAAFARWQAGWFERGWRIKYVEVAVEDDDKAKLMVDGRPTYLHGRIDRIDYHPVDQRWAILDYKTGDAGKTPHETHRDKKSGGWTDLQLPLYRHLARFLGLELDMDVQLAYVLLPKDVSKVKEAPAPWTPAELAKADETAVEVIRNVREEKFWPPAAEPPPFSQDFAAICQDRVL